MNSNGFKLGILGCGRWGINHVKTAYRLFGDDLVMVSDPAEGSAERVTQISDSIPYSSNSEDIVSDSKINAVIVATPAVTHYSIVRRLLLSGKNVLVEKPITLHSEEASELVEIAEKNDLKLMVGHVLLYHPAVVKLKELVREGKIGELQYIYSNRLNFGTVRMDENILWSFAPHDISIIQYLTETLPVQVEAMGASFLRSDVEDSTLTFLAYPGNVHAHIFVSWLHPFKEHRLVIIGDKGMLVFEDTLPKEKLKFFPKYFEAGKESIQKFEGEFEAVKYENKEPLAEEQLHFAESVLTGKGPLTDGKHALEVLQILERAERSLKHNAS